LIAPMSPTATAMGIATPREGAAGRGGGADSGPAGLGGGAGVVTMTDPAVAVGAGTGPLSVPRDEVGSGAAAESP